MTDQDRQNAFLVAFDLSRLVSRSAKTDTRQHERGLADRLSETVSLVSAAELCLVGQNILRLSEIKGSTFVGSGTLDALKTEIDEVSAKVVVFDCELTPVQQRNLERHLEVKIVDRVGLIIEIFGLRAQTKEGRLQVDLAALSYQRSRLVRAWTNLDRQRGGRGFTGGPGETRLELDRRRIDQQITKLKKALEEVRRTRATHRGARSKVPLPVAVLVGYTNAGKSSLFNKLTESTVMAKDMVFATLDPRVKRIDLPSGKACLLADTVGFISDLPTELIEAFHATLEEVESASLILHVRDIACDDSQAQKEDVLATLDALLPEDNYSARMLEVGNKADMLDQEFLGTPEQTIYVSATADIGLSQLIERIDDFYSHDDLTLELEFDSGDGKLASGVHALANVLSIDYSETGRATLKCKTSEIRYGQLKQLVTQSPNAIMRRL